MPHIDHTSDTGDGKRVLRHFLFHEPIDEGILPFDPDQNATNRYFADLVKDYVALKTEVADLRRRLAETRPPAVAAGLDRLLGRRGYRLAAGLFVAVVILFFSALPRYEWRPTQYSDQLLRVDRWTGRAELGILKTDWGRWVSVAELQQAGLYYR
jgi:hypothetical protein